jgi:uncharacterized protein (DUF1778 family)
MKTKLSEERISMRTSAEAKQFLTTAATLSGYNSLSSFILSTAHKEAQKIMNEAQTKIVSKTDIEFIISILNNPPGLNAEQKSLLLSAAKRYENTPDDEFTL